MENQEIVVQNSFDIPEWNMERLNAEVAKLNKRAAKIGVDPISVNILGERYEPKQELIRVGMTQATINALPKIKFVIIEIVGKGPKIEGYKFVGTLDHKTIPGSVIVQAVPGETVPADFFEADTTCDHCNKKRIRTETFVVECEDGSFMKVGRSCLKDFFGHNPEQIARFLTRLITFVGGLDDDDWGFGGGGYGLTYLNSVEVLKNTVAMIRTFGWVARSSCDFGDAPTADRVNHLMTYSPRNRDEQIEFKNFCDSIKHRDGDDLEAIKALNWLEDQTGDNSYIHNLKMLAKSSEVPTNMFGYWCSVVSTYQREMNKLEIKKRENAKKLNEYFGQIKERVDIKVEVVGISYTPSNFGTVTIVRMLDEDGRSFVWFANTDVEMDKGCKYKVKATITSHEEYRDWKQTKVNRLKVLEEVVTA